jgi:hypothetical protein
LKGRERGGEGVGGIANNYTVRTFVITIKRRDIKVCMTIPIRDSVPPDFAATAYQLVERETND